VRLVPNPFLILNRNKKNHIVDLGFITNNADPNIYVKDNDIFIYRLKVAKGLLTGAVAKNGIINYSSTMTLSEALLNSNIR
jgi:hypothetical protein